MTQTCDIYAVDLDDTKSTTPVVTIWACEPPPIPGQYRPIRADWLTEGRVPVRIIREWEA